MSIGKRWHAEVRVDIRTERETCVATADGDAYPALTRAKEWLADQMAEDFKEYAFDLRVRERMHDIAEDHKAYDGYLPGWEHWFVTYSRPGTMVHYRLTPCDGECKISRGEK